MQPAMRNLLEELHALASANAPKLPPSNRSKLTTFSWLTYALSLALFICAIVIHFTWPQSQSFSFALKILLILSVGLPIFPVILSLIVMLKDTLQWRKQYYESFITQINTDEKCVETLMRYSVTDLERASLWIKVKLKRDESVLSLFGTNKISIPAIFSLAVGAWASNEKLDFHEIINTYYMPAIYLLAFMIGIILGSIFIRILHKRYRHMQNWIELTIFEKSLIK